MALRIPSKRIKMLLLNSFTEILLMSLESMGECESPFGSQKGRQRVRGKPCCKEVTFGWGLSDTVARITTDTRQTRKDNGEYTDLLTDNALD